MSNHLSTHPGEVLREDVMKELGLSEAAFAAHLGIPQDTLSELLRGERPMTLEIAARVGKAVGNGARFWLALQMQYDVDRANELDVQVERLPTAAPAAA